jgi:HAD superfamily hydrolase (TIGR01509 family)
MADLVQELEAIRGAPLPDSFITDVRARQAIVLREQLQPMEGAVELLESMHLPYCMASNGLRAKMELTLGTTGLLHFFEGRIFSAYEIGSWKPEPELFLHAARHFGVQPSRCAVIEDSMPGILAGIAAGMQVFALLQPGEYPDLPESVVVIHSLRELHEHLIVAEGRLKASPVTQR